MKKLTKAVAIASMMTAGVMSAQTATAEVSASVDIANAYLFRGVNLNPGSPLISASLGYDHESGLYTNIWAGGADGSAGTGTEYDVAIGFAKDFGDFGVDVGYVTYIYPNSAGADGFNDVAEYYVGASFAGFGVSVTKPVDPADNSDYEYFSVDGGFGDFGVLVGFLNNEADDSNYAHLDVSYAHTDNLSFTASKVVMADNEEEDSTPGGTDQSLQFVASYSLPIEIK